jgi:hypothetical protein
MGGRMCHIVLARPIRPLIENLKVKGVERLIFPIVHVRLSALSKKEVTLGLRLVHKKKIFCVTLDVSEGCREEFSDTNKKINYRIRQETARRI